MLTKLMGSLRRIGGRKEHRGALGVVEWRGVTFSLLGALGLLVLPGVDSSG